MKREQIITILDWLGNAERRHHDDVGVSYEAWLPQEHYDALMRHLKLLLEASDPKGMVFEVKDDRLVVDGIEFVVPTEQFDRYARTGLLSVVTMRLARMYNIVRMWEGD